MAKLADAPDLGSGGKPWGFKSSHPHQKLANFGSLFLLRECGDIDLCNINNTIFLCGIMGFVLLSL